VRSLPEPCEEVISGRTGPPRCLATEARKGRARPVACELDEIPDGPPDVKNGIAPGDGGAVLWPLLIGFHRAKEYIMLGEPIDGPKAAEIGLINYCVPDEELDRAVDDMANKYFTDTQGAACEYSRRPRRSDERIPHVAVGSQFLVFFSGDAEDLLVDVLVVLAEHRGRPPHAGRGGRQMEIGSRMKVAAG
jgi:enoyl-CoA hydratase/carnithine racemase